MRIFHKKSFFAQILGASLMLFALGTWSGGCTLGQCELDEREICVGSDCTCGDSCSTDKNCDKENDTKTEFIERCMAYEFTQNHGVCVSKEFMKEHKNATAQNPYGRHLAIPGEPPEDL